MKPSRTTMQEFQTSLAPADVLVRAKSFFSRRNSLYAAFLEQEDTAHVTFRGQGGEELIIGVLARDGSTLVTGSSYIFDMQVARFFTTLPAAESGGLLPVPAAPAQVTA